MELDTLRNLYFHELKDLYSAEKQLTKALPKIAKPASNEELAAGFEEHLRQTEDVNRREAILKSHDQTTRGPKCKGMEGLIEEGKEMTEEDAEDKLRDLGLISGDDEGEELLQQTLDEEIETDEKLTDLAESVINLEAE